MVLLLLLQLLIRLLGNWLTHSIVYTLHFHAHISPFHLNERRPQVGVLVLPQALGELPTPWGEWPMGGRLTPLQQFMTWHFG